MPFNRMHGELIEALGPGHRIAPTKNWSDTKLFATSVLRAHDAFRTAGAMLPISITEDDALVQTYTRSRHVAFIFRRVIAGKEMFHVDVLQLTPGQVSELVMAKRWDDPKIN